ncbi:MAG: hydrogenase maturation protease [Verrucomicrobiia bacterium]
MKRVLVIGYGNPLRGDDGLGPSLASAIDKLGFPGVDVLVCHQLTPELADPISRADAVIFIDARVQGDPGIQLQRVAVETPGAFRTHASDPAALLALARALYGTAPAGWWLTLPAVELGFGEDLSPAAQESLDAGLAAFRELRERLSSPGNQPHESKTANP